MEIFNIISGCCSIVSFIVTILIASKVIKVSVRFNVDGTKSKFIKNEVDNTGILSGRDSNVYNKK